MVKIYLDRDQCEDFDIEYFGSDTTSLPADVILHSKRNGYDRKHTEILESYGREAIDLERTGFDDKDSSNNSWDSPGWYRIIERRVSMS